MTLNAPFVSIIIPAYNRADHIGETLDSVRAQTYQNWECIVVDDGSKDNTAGIVAQYMSYDSRIRYIYQRNQGPPAARNKGLKSFKGQYVQFCDSDDLIESRKIESHVRYLEEHREIDIVYGNVRYFRTERPNERRYSMMEVDTQWMPEISGAGKDVLTVLMHTNIMVVSAPLLRRSVVETVGYFDDHINLEDWDYWIRCVASGKRIQYLDLDNTLTLVRWHPTSWSKDERRVIRAGMLMRQKISRNLADEELLATNRKILEVLEKLDRDIERQGALDLIKSGSMSQAMWGLMKIGARSKSYHETAKWIFCALVAPFAPRDGFETIITAPASESILKILRHYLRYSAKVGKMMI